MQPPLLPDKLFSIIDQFAIISITDPQGIITYANEKFCAISGYTRQELIGQSHSIVRHRDTPNALFKELWQSITNHSMFHQIIKNRAKDGSDYYVDTYIFPITDETGVITAYLSLRYDVTTMQLAKQQLLDSKRKKEQMLQTFSHELLTPLNAINGLIDVLYLKEKHPEKRSLIQTTQNATKHLHNMLDDIIHLAHSTSNRPSPTFSTINLEEEIKQCAKQFLLEANKKAITFTLFIDPELMATLSTDKNHLYKILSHLISNAIKFTPTNGRVHINAVKQNQHAHISVEDSGIGINASDLKTIFEPFEQIQMDTTREHEGIGNGLSLAKELASQLDADIDVTSAEEQGSTFTFKLPLKEYVALSQQNISMPFSVLKNDYENTHIKVFERYLTALDQTLHTVNYVHESKGVLIVPPNTYSHEELELLCLQHLRIVALQQDPRVSYSNKLLQQREFFILNLPFSLSSMLSLQTDIEKLDALVLLVEPSKLGQKRLETTLSSYNQCRILHDSTILTGVKEKVLALYLPTEYFKENKALIEAFLAEQSRQYGHQCRLYLFGSDPIVDETIEINFLQTPLIDSELIESVIQFF